MYYTQEVVATECNILGNQMKMSVTLTLLLTDKKTYKITKILKFKIVNSEYVVKSLQASRKALILKNANIGFQQVLKSHALTFQIFNHIL